MLTEKVIRDAKADGKSRTIWDSQVPGLGLQVTRGGTRNFVVRYRVCGRKRQAILCRVGGVALAAVRKRAADELMRIRAGETDPLQREHDARAAPTVSEGLNRFFGAYVADRVATGRMAERTVGDYRSQAEKYVRPAIGTRKVAEVARRDVEAMLGRLRHARVQRNRVLAFVSRLFNSFETWGWRPDRSNPARGIDRAREEPRDRVLSAAEIGALSAALTEAESTSPASIAAIRFAAVTGLRIGEVVSVEWGHVDFNTGRLLLPKTKTGRRQHDLPAAALAILADLPRMNRWAFSTGRDAAVTYRTVRSHFIRVATLAGLEDVRLHDLRRTVMTRAAAAGIGTHVLRDLLGHKTTAMADRYVRAVGNPVRDARERIGAEMAAIMAGKSGEVVPMERRRA